MDDTFGDGPLFPYPARRFAYSRRPHSSPSFASNAIAKIVLLFFAEVFLEERNNKRSRSGQRDTRSRRDGQVVVDDYTAS
jgi:hypothetical protein